ncbi:prephenate dehydrogenase [Streptomyces sp. NPDC051162]|uniref:prephenate dehydrogenase n=1 Tax=Streptomyces sp. NPDC051162 TaxID=3154747 RepID=UPI00342D6249
MSLRTVAVVGTGLIGTSVALALTRAGIQVHLIDTDSSAARTAAALGAGTTSAPKEPVDLAVLAVPPSLVGPVLADQQRARLALSYTDVASVKRAPERDFPKHGVDQSAFVGGHPLAGRACSGPLGARADLFQDRTWVLTPSPQADAETLNRALSMVSACGAVPMVMESRFHDGVVALTSHVPHVLSALMAGQLLHAPDAAVRLAGTGLRDVTRIAASDPRLWGDILGENAADVANVLERLKSDLAQVIEVLRAVGPGDGARRAADMAPLTALLSRGVAGHSRLTDAGAPTPPGSVVVSVNFGDEPGALAELLARVGELVEAPAPATVDVDYETGEPGGRATFRVPNARAVHLQRSLAEEGWTVHNLGHRSAQRMAYGGELVLRELALNGSGPAG